MSNKNKNVNLYSPFEIVKLIESNKFVLPRFQRELDWKPDRISNLFDSIYKGFNINLVVLWKPQKNKPNYYFIKDYHYNKHNSADLNNISTNKYFVLDGQQRFEALFIGLYGSYTEKNGILKKMYFYINEIDKNNSFVFVSDNEYKERLLNKEFLLNVSNFRKCKNREKVIEVLINDICNIIKDLEKKLLSEKNEKIKNKLRCEIESYKEKINVINKSQKRIVKLYDKLNEKSIMYYFVDNKLDDDSIEELFIRMNTGGNQLSNSEIILSKLSTKWEINARDSINKLIDDINNWRKDPKDNKYKYDFSINLDLIMKSYFVLLDKQNVSFKLGEILNNDKLIKEMENSFEKIEQSLKNAFAFIEAYGFNHNVLRSNNAIIPIAYLIYKHKLYSKNPRHFLEKSELISLQHSIIKWLCVSILSDFWSGANDTSLVNIRTILSNYKGDIKNLDFYHKLKSNSEIGSNLTINKKMIDDTILNYSYNSSNAYSVLCILYLNNKNTDYIKHTYDVDHIFPKSKFCEKIYNEQGISKSDRKFYKNNHNLLPNLQLLSKNENRVDKKDKYFDEWIEEYYKPNQIKELLTNNYIDKVYKFNEFKEMFNNRKKALSKALLEIIK